MSSRFVCAALVFAVVASCGGGEGMDGGTGGGSVVAGGTAGGSVIAGGTAGGSIAGGTAGGSVAGGSAGGSIAGGSAGGSIAGGSAGGSIAGGSAGGSIAGGSAGGSIAGGSAGGSIAGGSAGGSIAGGSAGGSIDAGTPDAGCGCGARQCLGDGGCADCLTNQHCTAGAPFCDTTRNLCVQCQPSNDTCDAGTYCSAQGACVRGCRTGADCRSGLCLPSHDCVTCTSDSECDTSRTCGSGICDTPCTTTCTTPGFTCCNTRCVDPSRDPSHCGACNQPCVGESFCGNASCRTGVLSNVCQVSRSLALLDGLREDDDAGISMANALAASCPPTVTASATRQLDSGVLDAVTGEPILTGPMLCVGGGSFFQRSIGWLENVNLAPVRDTSTSTQYRLSLRDGGVVATGAAATLGPTHDLFVIQLVRTPIGSVVLNTGGFYGEGTTAGAWYFQNVLLPMRATLTSAWYVVEWTDGNANGPDMSDTFTQLAP
ncbi:MAG: hypothetical protein ABTQ32_29580 [Myxococcaceae bacterium]